MEAFSQWANGITISNVLFIIITAIGSYYLAMFKAQGKEEGKIEGRLNKLPTLVQIEEKITSIKVETEAAVRDENKSLLASVEKALSDAKHSSEFEYYNKKESSEKLEDFLYTVNSACEYMINSRINFHNKVFNLLLKLHEDEDLMAFFNGVNACKVELITPDVIRAKITFEIYYRHYNIKSLNEHFKVWDDTMLEIGIKLYDFHNNTIQLISDSHDFQEIGEKFKQYVSEEDEKNNILSTMILNTTIEIIKSNTELLKEIRK